MMPEGAGACQPVRAHGTHVESPVLGDLPVRERDLAPGETPL